MESLTQQLEALRTTVEQFRGQLPEVEATGKKLAAVLAGGGADPDVREWRQRL